MTGCCDDGGSLDRLCERQRGTLYSVLGINTVMFWGIWDVHENMKTESHNKFNDS